MIVGEIRKSKALTASVNKTEGRDVAHPRRQVRWCGSSEIETVPTQDDLPVYPNETR